MTFKRTLGVSALAAGIGMAGLLGVGLGTASADPGWGCDRPGAPQCDNHRDGRGPDRLVTALEVLLHPSRSVSFRSAA